MTARARTATLVIVLGAAAALRLHGLDWDQGRNLHPDERFLTMVTTAIGLPQSFHEYLDTGASPLNPANRGHRFFVYGTVPIFLVRFAASSLGVGGFGQVQLLGRAFSAFFDVGTAWLTYRLGVLLAGPLLGLAASALVAVSVLSIQQAHFFTVDSAAGFFATATLLTLLHVARGGRFAWHALFGASLGLTLGCRINLLPLAGVYALAVAHAAWRQRARPGVLLAGAVVAGLTAVLVFRLVQPYAFAGPGLFDVALAPEFVESMGTIRRLVTGDADYPPAAQWVGRTPVAFALKNLLGWCLGPAWGLAALAGVVWCLVRRRGSDLGGLVALWAAGFLLYHSSQFAATGRYFLPIVPALAVAAAWPLVAGNERWRRAALAAVLAVTTLWALAFTAIYRRPHTRVEASRWIYAHVPDGATIATEHWDDGLPLPLEGRRADVFRGVQLALYNEEDARKRDQLVEQLSGADWIVISSNRLYRSIPREPWRWPLARRYYELLFAGALGFRLEQVFTSYPRLGPLEIPDETAEEAFTVYDHPTVLVFRKTPDFERANVAALLGAVPLRDLVRPPPREASILYRRIQPPDVPLSGAARVRVAVAAGEMSSAQALVRWLVALEALSLAIFALVFGALPAADGGFGLARVLAWLGPGYLAWLLGSAGVPVDTSARARVVGGTLVVLGIVAAWRRRGTLRALIATHRRSLIAVQTIFFLTFVLLAAARAFNPALYWGEKPMNFAILNAILRSSSFPPPDPWFAGETLTYSYFGHALVAFFTRLTAVPPAIAYNLAIATTGALLAVAAFAAGRELAGTVRGGAYAALAVVALGNLAGPRLLLAEPGRPIDFDYYWATSRVIAHTVNEFPLWNLLFADLHAHVMAQPFEVALIALGALWVKTRAAGWSRADAPLALAMAWLLGTVAATSTWSVASMAAVLIALLVTGNRGILRMLIVSVGILAGSLLLFAPFWASRRPLPTGWGWEATAAPIGDVLLIFGGFLIALVPLVSGLRPLALAVVGLFAAGGALVRAPATGLFAAVCAAGVAAWWGGTARTPRAVAALVAVAGAIGVGTETIWVADRMNTIFKYYLDMWLVLGCAAAALVAVERSGGLGGWRRVWAAILVLAVACGLVTSATGAIGLLRYPRAASDVPTLDGMAYLRRGSPGELEAFQWLQREVVGVPVLLEAQGPSYQEFGRVSMNTGLPTVLGWEYHLWQQGHPRALLDQRRDDIRELYTTTDPKVAARLLAKYHVDLVFVGPLERLTYPAAGLVKFEAAGLEPVFRNRDVTIHATPGLLAREKTWVEEVHEPPPREAPPPAGQFREPRAIARAPDGSLYVADFGARRVQHLAADRTTLGAFGAEGSEPGEFRDPCGVAVAPDGTVYVADTWNQRVQVFSATGEPLREWSAGFYGPRGIAVGPDGSIWVTDTGNRRVVRFTPDGTLVWQSEPGTFTAPIGIALSATGKVYVAEAARRRIVVLSADGELRRQWPVDGWQESGRMEPYLDVGPDGVVWVTDPPGNRVLLYDRAGHALGVAEPEVPLEVPLGIAVVDAGHAVVTSAGTNTVVVVRRPP